MPLQKKQAPEEEHRRGANSRASTGGKGNSEKTSEKSQKSESNRNTRTEGSRNAKNNSNSNAAATSTAAPAAVASSGAGKSWASLARGAEPAPAPAPAPVVHEQLPSPEVTEVDMGGWGGESSTPDMFTQMMKLAAEGATSGVVDTSNVGWGAATSVPAPAMDTPEPAPLTRKQQKQQQKQQQQAPPQQQQAEVVAAPCEAFESRVTSSSASAILGAETVVAQGHVSGFVKNLQELWDNRHLCDLRLLPQEGPHGTRVCISVHSAVIAAVSPEIRNILINCSTNGGMPPELVVHIETNALEEMVRFMYTGELRIHDDSVANLMQAAATLGMTSATDLCVQFLGRNITAANALSVSDIALRFNRPELKRGVEGFLLQNIANLVLEADFLDQTVERVTELLSSDMANFYSEVDVFRAVVRWTRHNLPERAPLFAGLMADTVRLPLMTSEQLLDDVEGEELVRSDRVAQNLVFDTYRYQALPENRRDTMQIRGTVPRQTNRGQSNYF